MGDGLKKLMSVSVNILTRAGREVHSPRIHRILFSLLHIPRIMSEIPDKEQGSNNSQKIATGIFLAVKASSLKTFNYIYNCKCLKTFNYIYITVKVF